MTLSQYCPILQQSANQGRPKLDVDSVSFGLVGVGWFVCVFFNKDAVSLSSLNFFNQFLTI